jgi:hypothetical protein
MKTVVGVGLGLGVPRGVPEPPVPDVVLVAAPPGGESVAEPVKPEVVEVVEEVVDEVVEVVDEVVDEVVEVVEEVVDEVVVVVVEEVVDDVVPGAVTVRVQVWLSTVWRPRLIPPRPITCTTSLMVTVCLPVGVRAVVDTVIVDDHVPVPQGSDKPGKSAVMVRSLVLACRQVFSVEATVTVAEVDFPCSTVPLDGWMLLMLASARAGIASNRPARRRIDARRRLIRHSSATTPGH